MLVGTLATNGVTQYYRTQYQHETSKIEQVQANNDFWHTISGDQPSTDSVGTKLATDILAFYSQGDHLGRPNDNPFLPNNINRVVVPAEVYDGFEAQTDINAFRGVNTDSSYAEDAGKLRPEFIAQVELARSGDLTTLTKPLPPHKYNQYSWLVWQWYVAMFIVAGTAAYFLAGLYFIGDSLYYGLRSWGSDSGSIGAKFALAIMSPVVFTGWLAVSLVALPFKLIGSAIGRHRERKQHKRKLAEMALAEANNPYRSELQIARENRHRLEALPQTEDVIDELAKTNELINLFSEVLPEDEDGRVANLVVASIRESNRDLLESVEAKQLAREEIGI